ncbi:MAG TPA: hypothetical protein ENI10_09465 [Halomonas sp.]|nr:hypothetical protein [Halomonas sp.]HEB04803.1 hypothetical protein [Halomonas sp.]
MGSSIVYFGFTHCSDVRPAKFAHLDAINQRLGGIS